MFMMEISVTFLLTGCLIQGVFCDFNISLPERVEALQGSCVFIPCTFDIAQNHAADLTDSAKRLWYKDTDTRTPAFNSSRPNSGLLKGEIFGTATEKNCTTRFDNVSQSHNGSYYFRLEASGKLQYNYKKSDFSQVEIAVIDPPPKPTVSLFKDQQEVKKVAELTEESSVNLRCSTKIFCPFSPAVLTWSSSPEHLIKSITQQQRQEQTEFISELTFTVTHHHHLANFTCTVTHQQITKHRSRRLTLRVQYAPKNTSAHVSPSGSVMEGGSVTLSCSSNANPVLNYTWYRDTEDPLKPVQTGQNLTISNTDPTHSGRYVCRAQNEHGAQNASVLLDVQYAPKNTSAHVSPSGSVMEGGSVTLSCSSNANPVLNYTWYRDTEDPLKPVQTGQNLTISNTDPTHRGRYVCRAQNEHGAQNASVLLDVQFAPKISISCNQSIYVCEAHGNPSPELEWRLSGNVLANSTNTSIWKETLGNTSLKSVLIIHQPLTDMSLLQCFSANTHGTASQKFHPITSAQETETETSFHHPSVLLGAVVGALAMMIFCIMVVCYQRRNPKPSVTRQDDTSGLILAQTAIASDGEGELVYGMLSAVTPRSPESLHYSSIDFTNAEPASGEIRGASSLTDEYAVVRCRSESAKDPNQDQSPQDDCTDEYAVVSHSSASAKDSNQDQSPQEDMIYENMTRRLVV